MNLRKRVYGGVDRCRHNDNGRTARLLRGLLVVVNLGEVGVQPNNRTMIANADLDCFFQLADVKLAAL